MKIIYYCLGSQTSNKHQTNLIWTEQKTITQTRCQYLWEGTRQVRIWFTANQVDIYTCACGVMIFTSTSHSLIVLCVLVNKILVHNIVSICNVCLKMAWTGCGTNMGFYVKQACAQCFYIFVTTTPPWCIHQKVWCFKWDLAHNHTHNAPTPSLNHFLNQLCIGARHKTQTCHFQAIFRSWQEESLPLGLQSCRDGGSSPSRSIDTLPLSRTCGLMDKALQTC